jgi:hypothetical protein
MLTGSQQSLQLFHQLFCLLFVEQVGTGKNTHIQHAVPDGSFNVY